MTLKEHSKHTRLARPTLGHFGRHEYAVVGAPCGDIQQLAGRLLQALSPQWRCAYIDSDHAEAGAPAPERLSDGASWVYTDHISSRSIQYQHTPDAFQRRALFNEADLVIANGNHHEAAAQVVIIDPRKENSLKKRLGQLTNVQLILRASGETDVFDFLKEALPHWAEIPTFHLQETDAVVRFFENRLQERIPVLNGLVLAGGQSLRMGQDKGALAWHGKPQRAHMADLLNNICKQTFISCRADQMGSIEAGYTPLPDTFVGLGPYGAILSAFREQPEAAWLVVACDLPFLGADTLSFLAERRDPSKIATAFKSPHDGFPEPLIAIWEPKSYPVLLSFLAQGYSCPRKALINADALIISAPEASALANINTPEELTAAQAAIAHS